MKNVRLKTAVFALLAALIWGMAFPAQRVAAAYIGPFSLNFYRGVLAVPCLGAFLWLRRRKTPRSAAPGSRRRLALGGVVCGGLLFVASNLQQMGIAGTEAGKAGFITALYIVLVPVLGVLFLRERVSLRVWVSVAAATLGLYLICVRSGFTLVRSDMLVLSCAVVYAVYIIMVDIFVRDVDPVALSFVHFAVSAVLSGVMAFALESPSWSTLRPCFWSVAYVGVFSSAVAYTLQFTAQQLGRPVTVTLLLSMESVFSLLGGAVLLGERLTLREGLGCLVMFCAVILAQLPEEWLRRKKE